MTQKVYVITPYYSNIPPAHGQHNLYVYSINGRQYCIAEVELEWGQAQVAIPIEEQSDFISYKYFQTYDEAFEYVKLIKELNR